MLARLGPIATGLLACVVQSSLMPGPRVLAFDPTGAQVAAGFTLDLVVDAPVASDVAGDVFFGSACGVVELDPMANVVSKSLCGDPPDWTLHIESQAALDAAGAFIVSDGTGALRGVRGGVVVFSLERLPGNMGSNPDAPAIGPDGTIVAGSTGKLLYAFR
jgi:hypothetical protein